jgi:hypothetical protein
MQDIINLLRNTPNQRLTHTTDRTRLSDLGESQGYHVHVLPPVGFTITRYFEFRF